MKRLLSIAALLLACPFLRAVEVINTDNTTLVLNAVKGKPIAQLYYGSLLINGEAEALWNSGSSAIECYPAHGLKEDREEAISVIFPDGNVTLDLRVESVRRQSWEGGEILEITSRDTYYPFSVISYYKSYRTENTISTWTEIINDGKKSVELCRFDSGCLPFRVNDPWISTFYGKWANDCRLNEEALVHGTKVIRNRDGVRNSQTSHSEAMISLDGRPNENFGPTIGAALCYSGNYELRFNYPCEEYATFHAGICPEDSHYTLSGNEHFTTPELAFSFSKEGLGGVSRNFHRWGRKYKLAHPSVERKILLNSWEGVFRNVNEEGMEQMMNDIAQMGGELFVMDDGWFGDKYPRDTDRSTLGDWMVDRRKLPHGIGRLVEMAGEYGLKFGIWIEPEMVCEKSELYEKHPDWALKAANREPSGSRQMTLDLSNPKVQDFIFDVVDDLMRENPGIDYIKWDANAAIEEHGSPYLKNQSHLYIEYHRGLANVLNRIRAKYPDLTIQACASGGGRANYGILPWFDDFWCSDNIDPIQRLSMQWGESYFYPAIAIGSHVAAAPNRITGRVAPLKFRIDMALSGRFGLEILTKKMTDDEKALCARAIEDYKAIRHIVQFGDLYRLNSPEDGDGVSSLMYCTEDKSEAVFFWWKPVGFRQEILPRVKMNGLDPQANYRISELHRTDAKALKCEGKSFSGRFLMDNGLDIPSAGKNDADLAYGSRVLYLERL